MITAKKEKVLTLDIKQRRYHFQSASTLSVMRRWKKLPGAHVIDINVKMAQASHGLWEHSGREPSPQPAGSRRSCRSQTGTGCKARARHLPPASQLCNWPVAACLRGAYTLSQKNYPSFAIAPRPRAHNYDTSCRFSFLLSTAAAGV